MPVLESRISSRDPEFVANAQALQAMVQDLQQKLQQAALGGGNEARKKHVARGKLLPRDRVNLLLDPGSPFLELSPLAAHGLYEGAAPGAGVIT
ncbi:MAG: methylcrotonoyl-CoA carboxylase, partial [Burkholderiales bacterium]